MSLSSMGRMVTTSLVADRPAVEPPRALWASSRPGGRTDAMRRISTALMVLVVLVVTGAAGVATPRAGALPSYPTDVRWPSPNLTYTFNNGTGDIAGTGEYDAVRAVLALGRTRRHCTSPRCRRTRRLTSKCRGVGDRGDGVPFGPNVAAHSFFPDTPSSIKGDVHFNDAETWTPIDATPTSGKQDLVSTAAHEIGHAIGMKAHSADWHSVMSGTVIGPPHRSLTAEDVARVQALYGPPAAPTFSIDDVTVTEPTRLTAKANFTVSLSPGATGSTRVHYTTAKRHGKGRGRRLLPAQRPVVLQVRARHRRPSRSRSAPTRPPMSRTSRSNSCSATRARQRFATALASQRSSTTAATAPTSRRSQSTTSATL